MNSNRQSLISSLCLDLSLLLVITAGFFWRLLFTPGVYLPAGGGDLANFLYPTYRFVAESWRQGTIPLWNPYVFGGMPAIGDIQTGVLYPINLLVFFLADPLTFRHLELLAVAHFFLAGAGMYALLRFGQWRPECDLLARSAALLGAVAFEYSDFFITHFGNLNLIAGIAWLPWVVLCFHRGCRASRPEAVALSGLLLGIAFLAGHIQSFLFIILTLGLIALWFAVRPLVRLADDEPSLTGRVFTAGRPLLYLALAVLIAALIAAPVLLPALEMTELTVRADFPYERAADFSLPPAQLIGLFIPGFFGRGPTNAWGPWPRVEVGYLGVFPLLLALLAPLLAHRQVSKIANTQSLIPQSLHLFILLSLAGLALALGGYAIVHGWLYQFVPGFGSLRAPARFVVLLDFGLASLAALAFDRLCRPLAPESEQRLQRLCRLLPWAYLLIVLALAPAAYVLLAQAQTRDPVIFARQANAANAIAFFLLLLGLSVGLLLARRSRFVSPQGWAVAALILVIFDLHSLGAYVDLGTTDPMLAFDRPGVVATLTGDRERFRLDSRTNVDDLWPPTAALLHRQRDVYGDNPLMLSDFHRYWEGLGSRSTPLYDMLNVKYVLVKRGTPLDTAKFAPVTEDPSGLMVYANRSALPAAWVVYRSQVVAGKDNAWTAIHAPGFAPTQTVVLAGGGPVLANDAIGGSVAVIVADANALLLEVNAAAEGIVVVSEVWYPGWRAWVDGQETPVLLANYLFRGVAVPAGRHQVRLVYDPPRFRLGLVLAGLALLGLCGFVVRRTSHLIT